MTDRAPGVAGDPPIIAFESVTYAYPESAAPALREIDWRVAPGEFVTITGPSGSGKSTLLRCLNGLTPHFSGGTFDGAVTVAGHDTRRYTPRALARVTGFVFQDPEAQFVTSRVDDELAFGMEQLGVPPLTMRKRVEEVLDLLGIAALRDREIATLSGGERQRVAVAAALALQPEILALDEPTSQLDPWGAEEVLAALTRLNDDLGLTIVLAEHRLERVVSHADRLTLLDRAGHIASEGRPRDVLAGADPAILPALLALGRQLDWQPLPLTVKEGRAAQRRDAAVGRLPAPAPPDPPAATGPAIVALQRVSAGWGQRKVLREIDLEVRPGELVALMGRNGSGKTTLLRLVAGLHRPASGRVLLEGADTARLHPADIAQTTGYLPQNPSALFFAETLRDELAFTLKHKRGAVADPEVTLAALGLAHALERNPRDLSGGERERAALAAVLVGAPRVLLLDEPTRGMDAARKRALATTLAQLREEGVAILLATHDVELVAEVATRVVLIGDGRVVADGGPRAVLSGSLTFATAINKLYGGGFLTPDDILAGFGRDRWAGSDSIRADLARDDRITPHRMR
ncbi:MAG: ATP-binding cassette domain-containing protein [Thermomicrobiales bacterium]|nr:ATP-binding cassette domain-containing protein [Thermomicrobiales bacterium]